MGNKQPAASPPTPPTPAPAPPGAEHPVVPLPFDPATLRGISEKMIVSHHDNNYAGAVKNLNGVEKQGVKVFHAGTELCNGRFVTAGGRVLGVTAKAPTLPTAMDLAYATAERIQFHKMHFRRDIGRKGLMKERAASPGS